MSEFDALKTLGAFPIVQAAVALIIVFTGILLMRRGERGRSAAAPPPPAVPQWLLMAPAHDAIGAVHDIAEEIRQQTRALERCEGHLMNIKTVLEAILNESRLR